MQIAYIAKQLVNTKYSYSMMVSLDSLVSVSLTPCELLLLLRRIVRCVVTETVPIISVPNWLPEAGCRDG